MKAVTVFTKPVQRIARIATLLVVLLPLTSLAQTLRTLPGKDSVGLLDRDPVTRVISFDHIKRYDPVEAITYESVSNYIPTDIANGSNGDQVMKRILDRSLQTFLNHRFIKKSNFVKVARTLSDKVETDFNFSTGQEALGEKKVKHNVKIQMRAFESLAVIKYRGFFRANIKYNINRQVADLELSQALSKVSSISLTHHLDSEKTRSMVRFNLNY